MSLRRRSYLIEAKELMWHGTSSKLARKILSSGFVPDPKKKVWSQDKGHLESYYGTYFTHNWMTAYSSAGTAYRKLGGNRVIFGVQIETRTTLPDEDNIPTADGALARAAGNVPYLNSKLAKSYLSSPSEAKKWFNKAEKEYRKFLEMFTSKMDNRAWKAILPFVRKYLRIVAKAAAESQKGPWSSVDYSESRYPSKEIRQARSKLMSKLRSMATKVRPKEKFHMNVRVDKPVTFRGANKIISAVEIVGKEDEPTELRVVYGKMLPKFIAEYKKNVGGEFVVK